MSTTKEQRRQHVATMRANFGIESIHPDAQDLAWQERYIEGTASLDDLLNYARSFAEERRKREDAINYGRASNALSGFTLTGSAEVYARKFIDGEMTIKEFIENMPHS
jgi:hypothetical protein